MPRGMPRRWPATCSSTIANRNTRRAGVLGHVRQTLAWDEHRSSRWGPARGRLTRRDTSSAMLRVFHWAVMCAVLEHGGRRKTNGGRGRRSLRPSDSWRPFGRSARDRVGLAPPSRPWLPRNATEASRRPGVPLRQRVWGSLAGKRGGRKDEAVHGDATARSRAWFPECDPLVPSSEDRHAPIVALATGLRAGEIPSAKAASMLRLIDRRDLSSGGGTRVRGRWAARGRAAPRP